MGCCVLIGVSDLAAVHFLTFSEIAKTAGGRDPVFSACQRTLPTWNATNSTHAQI
ncbi:MAG TPA: hypothetical protein VNV43_06640 [Candidatus Acidoferrales bacterium]|nr:hypothetical protein [Candidatus Acidoferrales bacterium]